MELSRLYCALLFAVGVAHAAPVPEHAASIVEVEAVSEDYNTAELRFLIVVGVVAIVLWFARVAYYCRMEDKLDSESSEDKTAPPVDAPRYFFSPR